MHAPRAKALSGIDLSKPTSTLIADVRHQIVGSRAQLDDIGAAFPGYKQDMEMVQGLLSCGLVTLHWIMEEMRKLENDQSARALAEQQTEPSREAPLR